MSATRIPARIPARIPTTIAALIKKTWPGGVIEEFDIEECAFPDILAKLERDLGKIRGASLAWQTEAEEQVYRDCFDEDYDDGPELDRQFQSYHVFFLAPDGDEFRFETEGTNLDVPEDPEEEDWSGTELSGEGVIGCSAAVCLAAPVALVDFSDRLLYEDGSSSVPDIDQCIVSDKSGERVTPEDYYRSQLSPEAFQMLKTLRAKVVAALQKRSLEVLDESVLGLPVPGLKASKEVFVGKPIRVRDAFFFRGV